MQEKTEPNWLKFTGGEEVIAKLVCDQSVHQVNHWVGGKPEYCRGEDCKYCHAGIPTRERDLIDVEVEGERYVMTLPTTSYEQMISECVAPHPMQGRVIGVFPSGPASNRGYKFRLVSEAYSEQDSVEWPLKDKVKLFANTLREMADDLEEMLLEKE